MSREEKHSERAASNRCSNLEYLLGMNMMGTRSILMSFISGGDSFAETWALSLTNHALQEELESERIRFISSKREKKGFALKDERKFKETGAICLDDAKFFTNPIANYKSKLISNLFYRLRSHNVTNHPNLMPVELVLNKLTHLELQRTKNLNNLSSIEGATFETITNPACVIRMTFSFGYLSLILSAELLFFAYFFMPVASLFSGETPVTVNGVNYAEPDHAKTVWLWTLGASSGIVARLMHLDLKRFLRLKNMRKHSKSIKQNMINSHLEMAREIEDKILETTPLDIQRQESNNVALLPDRFTRELIKSTHSYSASFMSDIHRSILFQHKERGLLNRSAQEAPIISDQTTLGWLEINALLQRERNLLLNVDKNLFRLLTSPLEPITPPRLLSSIRPEIYRRTSNRSTIIAPYKHGSLREFDNLLNNVKKYLPSNSEGGDADQRAIDALVSDTLREPLLEEEERSYGPHRV